MHAIAVAQGARAFQIRRVVHGHAGRALHQRLDDQRGDLSRTLAQQRLEFAQRASGHVGGRFVLARLARVRRHHDMRAARQRIVGIAKDLDIGHGQRADRLAVIAMTQAHEFALGGQARVAPEVKAHLQRDLDGRCAVGRIERIAERALRQRRQALGQLHRRRMRAAGQHDVFKRLQLLHERRVDRRIGVAEQVDPPRTDGVEIALAVGVDQPGAVSAGDGQRRFVGRRIGPQARARMPDGALAAHRKRRVAARRWNRDRMCQRDPP